MRVPWSPDGKRIASASYDGTVQIWDPTTGRMLLTLGDQKIGRWAVAWSPDGPSSSPGSSSRLVSAFGNDIHENGKETVQVWDATTGRTLLTYNGHGMSSNVLADGVLGLAWSPNGKRI